MRRSSLSTDESSDNKAAPVSFRKSILKALSSTIKGEGSELYFAPNKLFRTATSAAIPVFSEGATSGAKKGEWFEGSLEPAPSD